jgi:hypothetical protein
MERLLEKEIDAAVGGTASRAAVRPAAGSCRVASFSGGQQHLCRPGGTSGRADNGGRRVERMNHRGQRGVSTNDCGSTVRDQRPALEFGE